MSDITFKQLNAAKLITLHSISLDGRLMDFQIHSREIRRSFQWGGGDYLLDYHQFPSNKGLIRLLNRLVQNAGLIPNADTTKMVGIFSSFSNGNIGLDLRTGYNINFQKPFQKNIPYFSGVLSCWNNGNVDWNWLFYYVAQSISNT